MLRFESLQDDKREDRRSMADAINLLQPDGTWKGEIQVRGLNLLSEEIVGLVAVFVENAAAQTTSIVTLPSAKQFRARRYESQEFEEFDIFRLDRATFDGSCNVGLVDGTRLRAVEVIPALLPYNVTDLDWCILHHTIAMMKAEQECYTYPIRFAQPSDALDCSRLPSLTGRVPLLKQIHWYIADREPALKDLSEQKIADALCKFGMRIPRPRRTRRLRSTAAA
ncbi:hypothetical protein ACVWWG_008930 [Bradyrhizobium sp. LB7.2]